MNDLLFPWLCGCRDATGMALDSAGAPVFFRLEARLALIPRGFVGRVEKGEAGPVPALAARGRCGGHGAKQQRRPNTLSVFYLLARTRAPSQTCLPQAPMDTLPDRVAVVRLGRGSAPAVAAGERRGAKKEKKVYGSPQSSPGSYPRALGILSSPASSRSSA